MKLTYQETVDIIDIEYIAGQTIAYTPPPGTFKISDPNLILKSLLPKEVKLNSKNDDNRPRSNLTINKKMKSTKKSFSTQ